MPSVMDAQAVTEALARQGYDLPPGRAETVAAAAGELAATARGLEDELPFEADQYGLAGLLAEWRARS
jgi:hypothetical protein